MSEPVAHAAGPEGRRLRCRLRRLLAPLAACLLLLLLPTRAPDAAERDRVALVIGNSHYDELPDLENPYNDAKAVAAALWEAGFETIEVLDADREEMIAAIATFSRRIGDGTDAVFYFAGHGVQSGGGNWLLPVSIRIEDANRLREAAIDANEIVELMGGNRARINVLILDACRNNPFAEARSVLAEELSRIDPQVFADVDNPQVVTRAVGGLGPLRTGRAETVVGYATSPGEVALDGEGRNSPYTQALVEYLHVPGLEIDPFFRRVRASVRERTGGQQIPWVASTLESEFYFRPPATDRPGSLAEALAKPDEDIRRLGLAPPSSLVEEALWRVAATGGAREDLELYLQRFPDGVHAEEAKARLSAAPTEEGPAAEEGPASEAGTAAGGRSLEAEEDAIVAWLGTGPVPLGLAPPADLPQPPAAWRVVELPTAGTLFRADETPVDEGHLVAAEELAGLLFVPLRGTKSVGLVETLRLEPLGADGDGAADAAIVRSIRTEIHACDLLAGFRYAPDRVWDGVEQAILNLDPEPAIEACRQAVKLFPETVRFAALLARAYSAARRFEEAWEWAENAAGRGYAPGMSQLGTILMRGQLGEPDYARAKELFERAYELGNPAAALRIGEMYEGGLGVPRDLAQAVAWYEKAIGLGNAYAATRLARLYEAGRGVPADMEKALALYRQAAEAGELTAQLRLARILFEGRAGEPDPESAGELFRAAAGTGMPEGQKALGQYHEWLGEREGAIYWYEKASGSGDPWAPVYLARLLLEDGAEAGDPDRARELLELAVRRGNADAARELAKLHAAGRFGEASEERALHWHRIAAQRGNIWSMRDLALALIEGRGTEADPAAGLSWMRAAVAGGHPWAQRDLGTFLAKGELVARDPLEAARLLGLAAASGDAKAAASARERLSKLLGEKERVRAVQTWLGELGHDAGIPDGLAGPRTRSAIAAFAADRGLPAFDPASPDLVAALASALAELRAERTAALSDEPEGADE